MFPELLYQHLVRITHKLAGAILARPATQWSFSWVKRLTVLAVVLLLTQWTWSCVSQKPSVSTSHPAGTVPWILRELPDYPSRLKKLQDLSFEIATS